MLQDAHGEGTYKNNPKFFVWLLIVFKAETYARGTSTVFCNEDQE